MVDHIVHNRKNSEDCSFYICNVFKIKNKKIEFNDLFEFDLFNEKYFYSEKQLKEIKENNLLSSFSTHDSTKAIIIDPYGPIIRSKIHLADFEKLSYEEYILKIKYTIESWRKTENGFEEDLEKFHLKSLNELQSFDLEKREYYFLNAMLIENDRKHEFSYIYSYFFTIVGIDYKSNTFIILNYGND